MNKLRSTLLATLSMAVATAPASADEIVTVTPGDYGVNAFDGQYQYGYDEHGHPRQGMQQGYVALYDDGVEACNGNPEHELPDGRPAQGYIWVGPAHAATGARAPDPTGVTHMTDVAGAGTNNQTENGSGTGQSPCPEGGHR